jgi:hypothetical protein
LIYQEKEKNKKIDDKKPFSKTEMKILIYNKVRNGMSYENACIQLAEEIEKINQNKKKVKPKNG